MEKQIKVHSVMAEITGMDGKIYDGMVAFGADSWAARGLTDDMAGSRDNMAEAAAIEVAKRHCESMGVEVDEDVDPTILGHKDEELTVEV